MVYTNEDVKSIDQDKEIGLPGEFPYANSAYREMYLDPLVEGESKPEEVPTALCGAVRP